MVICYYVQHTVSICVDVIDSKYYHYLVPSLHYATHSGGILNVHVQLQQIAATLPDWQTACSHEYIAVVDHKNVLSPVDVGM